MKAVTTHPGSISQHLTIKITYSREAKVTNEATSHKPVGTNGATPCLSWHHFISKLLTPHSKLHNLHLILFLYKCAFVESDAFVLLLIDLLPLVLKYFNTIVLCVSHTMPGCSPELTPLVITW